MLHFGGDDNSEERSKICETTTDDVHFSDKSNCEIWNSRKLKEDLLNSNLICIFQWTILSYVMRKRLACFCSWSRCTHQPRIAEFHWNPDRWYCTARTIYGNALRLPPGATPQHSNTDVARIYLALRGVTTFDMIRGRISEQVIAVDSILSLCHILSKSLTALKVLVVLYKSLTMCGSASTCGFFV